MLTGTNIPLNDCLRIKLGMWSHQFLANDFRQFLFLFNNNTVGVNHRINAFNNDIDARCTFCRIINGDTVTVETFNHLFFRCPTTFSLLTCLTNRFEPRPLLAENNFLDVYWYGVHENANNLVLLLIFDVFRFCIWKFKQRRKVPNQLTFLAEFDFILEIICKNRDWILVNIQHSNLLANLGPAHG